MVVALHVGGRPRLGGGDGIVIDDFTIELEGSLAEPAFLVEEKLVDTHGVGCTVVGIIELGVIEHIGASLVVLTG